MFSLFLLYIVIAGLVYYALAFIIDFECQYLKNQHPDSIVNRPPEMLIILLSLCWLPQLMDVIRFARELSRHPEPDPERFVKVPLTIRVLCSIGE